MVARWNRTVRKTPVPDSDVATVATAMRSVRSNPKDNKGKKNLGTTQKLAASTRSVSSRTTKTKLSTSKSIKSVRSTPKESKGKKKPGTARQLAPTRSVSSRTTKTKTKTKPPTIKTRPPTPKSTKSTAGTPKSSKGQKKIKIARQLAMSKMPDPKEWDPTMRPPTPRKLDGQPKGTTFVKPCLPPPISTSCDDTSTSYATEAEMPANPSPPTPSSFRSPKNTTGSSPTSAHTKPNVEQFQEATQPHPSCVEEPTSNGRTGSFADSEADFSEYTFITEDGTEYKVDEVTFEMFLGDVKGYVVDKSGKMIPTGPEMAEFLRKTKETAQDAAAAAQDAAAAAHDIVPESVKNNINHTAQVLDPRDISGGELLASAKEIGAVTKDVVVEETAGCAAWSFAEIFASLQKCTEKEHIRPEADDLPDIEPMMDEELPPADEQLQAENVQATVTEELMPTRSETVPNVPTRDTSPTSPTASSVAELFKQEQSANYSESVPEEIVEQVSVEASIKQHEKSPDDQSRDYLSSPSKELSTITDEGNVDTDEYLRQIKNLNKEMERLMARGDPADVDLAEVLKHRSKVLGKNMAAASARAAKTTGRVTTRAAIITSKAAVRTSKAVGQASSSVTKSSKKGLGTALLSTSKAMSSLGEKLASKYDDTTHSTGETSTLSSRSRSRSNQRGNHEKIVLVSR